MVSTLPQSSIKSAREIAKKTARQMAREPLEILNTAKSQINPEKNKNIQKTATGVNNVQPESITNQEQERINLEEKRKLRDIERELEEVRKQELLKSLQEKISRGEIVYLNDYPGLSWEEKQVLTAQMAAIEARKKTEAGNNRVSFEPQSKPSRKMGAKPRGIKAKLDELSSRIETRMSPSG